MAHLKDPGESRMWSRGIGAALLSALSIPLVTAGERHYLTPPPPLSTKDLGREERAIARAFERVNPAVVVLLTEETEIVDEDGELRMEPGKGVGSGVVISDQGDILTAAHVVTGSRSDRARLSDGSEVDVSIVFSDTASDIAVLRLASEHPAIPPPDLGDSDSVQPGQAAPVIGAPLGAEHSLSVGHISARRKGDEFFGGAVEADVLQTDAAVNHGNSGGPLVNPKGGR